MEISFIQVSMYLYQIMHSQQKSFLSALPEYHNSVVHNSAAHFIRMSSIVGIENDCNKTYSHLQISFFVDKYRKRLKVEQK